MHFLNRELGRDGGLNRRDLEVGIEGFVVAQDAPGDAGELVGQGDGELVPVQSLRCRFEPRAEADTGASCAGASGGPSPPGSTACAGTCCPAWRCGRGSTARRCCIVAARGRARHQNRARVQRPRRCRSRPQWPVEISGPMPGTLISRWHLASTRLSSSISPVTVSMRSSRRHQSS